MKIRLQITEFVFSLSFTMAIIGSFFAFRANILGTSISLILIIAAIIYAIVEVTISNKKYGQGIWYNRLFNTFEFHIGSLTDWSMIAKRAARIRRLALKKGVSVLFYTDHYKEERLHELAKNTNISIEIRRANPLQWLAYKCTSIGATFYKIEAWKRKKYPLVRCIMEPGNNKSGRVM